VYPNLTKLNHIVHRFFDEGPEMTKPMMTNYIVRANSKDLRDRIISWAEQNIKADWPIAFRDNQCTTTTPIVLSGRAVHYRRIGRELAGLISD
jgi:hypothetical protein